MTVNSPDLGDVFELELDQDHPGQYRTPDGWRPFELRQEVFRIKTENGIVEKPMPLMNSEFGPVVARAGAKAFTIRLSIPPGEATVEEGYGMMTAKNLKEFKDALRLQGFMMFNILFADQAGDIYYVSNGRVARRSDKIDSHRVRPAAKAWADWDGIHPLEELPQLENPTSAYLFNTNSGPQNVTSPGAPTLKQFPDYMIGHRANSRSRRLSQLLADDSSVTWDEMITYATDTRLEVDAVLAKLFACLEPRAQAISDAEAERLQQVIAILKAWDRRADLDSKGTVLFYHLATNQSFVDAFAADDRVKAQMAAVEIADDVRSKFGQLDAPWKAFSVIRRGDKIRGVAGWMPTRLVGSTLRPLGGEVRNAKHFCGGGSSYGMVIDFAGETRSVSCLPFGVSENPASPHFDDMLPLYCQRKFKPTWFLPGELKQNIESEVVLNFE